MDSVGLADDKQALADELTNYHHMQARIVVKSEGCHIDHLIAVVGIGNSQSDNLQYCIEGCHFDCLLCLLWMP